MSSKIDRWLQQQLQSNTIFYTFWAGLATFLTYFCMYMYRKPFTAASYDQIDWGNLDYKIILVVAQVAGYAISKFAGIKIISELKTRHRGRKVLILIFISWLGLVGFALSPPVWGPIWLFINGLPLGLIWGIVFSYCEGRKITEILTVVLSINFILSSGFAKTFGSSLLILGIHEQAMPMVIGFLIFPFLLLSIWMLEKIPLPTAEEKSWKMERKPMSKNDKNEFWAKYKYFIILFILLYLVLTIIRDIRDNFAPEIWADLGFTDTPAIYSATELPVASILLICIGTLYLINDHQKALKINLAALIVGISLLLIATILFDCLHIPGMWWMILSGVGLFLPYILLNGIIFDRFMAAFSINANVGFIMYLADATGYLGSVLILLYKNLGPVDLSWKNFYLNTCIYLGIPALVISLTLLTIFSLKVSQMKKIAPLSNP